MKRLVGGLVLVVLLLLGADRLAAARAGSTVADRAASALSVSDVDAKIHGFPFLTQVMGDELKHVTLTTPKLTRGNTTFQGLTVDGYGVALKRSGLTDVTVGDHADRAGLHADRLQSSGGTLQDVTGQATGIRIGDSLTLGQVDGQGLVSNATIAEQVKDRVGMDVTAARKGDDIGLSGSVLGQDLTATATPSVVSGGLRIAVDDVKLNGAAVSAESLQNLTGTKDLTVTVPVDLSSLPGMKLTGVDATDKGLALHLSGKNVTLSQ